MTDNLDKHRMNKALGIAPESATPLVPKRRVVEPLDDRQRMFVMEYLIDLNGTQAAIRAGYDPRYADKASARLMRKGSPTQIAVARALAERSARVGVTADRVIREIAKLAFGDPRVLFREDGALRAPHEYGEDDAAMIEGIKTRRIVEVAVGEDGKQKMVPVEIQEVKLASKGAALQMLMRHLGLNNDKLDVTVNMPLAQRLAEAYQRTGRGALPGVAEVQSPDGSVMHTEYEEVDVEDGDGQPPEEDELARMLR